MPVGPRGFSIITNPTHFEHGSDTTFFFKKTQPELKVFNSFSNSTGSTVYSEPIRVAPAEGLSAYTSGTGTVTVEASVDPGTGVWATIDTLTDSDIFATNTDYAWIRIGVANAASNMDVWVYRKYKPY